MNKQEIKDKMKELEEQLSKLKEKFDSIESKEFSPKYYDSYYTVIGTGETSYSIWTDDGTDIGRYSIGNCFRTQEEAEFAAEKLKVIAELKRFANLHNEPLDWNDASQCKHYLAFSADDSSIRYGFARTSKQNDIYFSSMILAQQAVETIGEERLKKYYFEV